MNVATDGTEAIRDALQQADEAFLYARRRLANRKDADVDALLEKIDGAIDEAMQHARDGDFELAERNLLAVKLMMRKLAGVQHECERIETEAYLSAAREAMDEALQRFESVLASAEYGALAERRLRKAAPEPADEFKPAEEFDPLPRSSRCRMSRREQIAWLTAAGGVLFVLAVIAGNL